MRKILSVLMAILLSSCAYGGAQREFEDVANFVNSGKDIDGWRIIKIGKWEYNEKKTRHKYSRKTIRKNISKGRERIVWQQLDAFKSYDFNDIERNDGSKCYRFKMVYIGEWKYDEQLGKNIRLIVKQSIGDHKVKYSVDPYFLSSTYETMDEKNKDIPSMELSLIAETGMRSDDELVDIGFDKAGF